MGQKTEEVETRVRELVFFEGRDRIEGGLYSVERFHLSSVTERSCRLT